jgi:hypothetical protein
VDEAPANNVAWKKNQPIAKKNKLKLILEMEAKSLLNL